jgi:hypothetical protein
MARLRSNFPLTRSLVTPTLILVSVTLSLVVVLTDDAPPEAHGVSRVVVEHHAPLVSDTFSQITDSNLLSSFFTV